MRPKKNIEKFVRVRKPNVTTSRQMDKRTLDDSFAAMEETIRAKSAGHKPSALRIIIRSRMMKLTAAAAVIIVGIGLFVARQGPSEQKQKGAPKIAVSPAEMTTVISLTMAYHRGGIEEVERQCDKAVQILGPRAARISLRDLFEGSNS